MQVYLVGGAVRDRLLGLPVTERDWVVVGGSPEALVAQGYRAVGRDFPVFLHPTTQEEYALARTERKTAPGYHGFVFDYAPGVTLEEDLGRRDLTVNAMAEDGDGHLIDPYHGRNDLDGRWLRHISPAFAEDPVRILRVARFAARFAPLGFRIAPETRTLMRAMVEAGEVAALVPERVWAETAKALSEPDPVRYFEELRECGTLAVLFPELDREWTRVLGRNPPFPLAALAATAAASRSPRARFAALAASLTLKADAAIEALCARLKVPNDYRELAILVLRGRARADAAFTRKATEIVALLEELDALRRPERFAEFLSVAQALAAANPGSPKAYPQGAFLAAALAIARAVKLPADTALEGPAAGAKLRALRVAAVEALKRPPA